MKGNQKAVAAFLTLLFVAVAFAGSPPGPLSYVHETCYDGLDNDMDGVYGGSFPLVLADTADGECIWMPLEAYGNGEYDTKGLTDPISTDPDVQAYVGAWSSGWSSELPTHYSMVKAMVDKVGGNSCGPDVQNALSAYKNDFGLPDEMTGASQHQSECGVSY